METHWRGKKDILHCALCAFLDGRKGDLRRGERKGAEREGREGGG